MKKLMCIAALPILLWITPCSGGQNNYTWVDEKGTTNITDDPPPPDAEIVISVLSRKSKRRHLHWRHRQNRILMPV